MGDTLKKFIIFLLFFININVSASINKYETLNYIDDLFISIKKDNNTYFYSFDNNKYIPYNKTLNKNEYKNIYYSNIIKNGYPNKSITGDDKKDYYITQVSIFLLNDYLKNINYDQNGILYKDIKLSKNEILDKSKELLNQSVKDANIIVSDNKLKIEDNNIISFSYNNKTYNKDEILTIDNIDSIDINLNYNTIYYYSYNDNYQNLISSEISDNTTSIKKTFTINKLTSNENKYKVTINNYDTNNTINDSIFIIENTSKKINLSDKNYIYLENGNYSLRQIQVSDKYVLYDKSIKFTVSNSDININVFNEIKKTKILVGFIKNNKYLKNINLTLKDYEGNIIKKFKTEDKLLNLNLNTGIYTITDGNSNFNFSVKQDGQMSLIKLGNYLKPKIPNLKNIKSNNIYLGIFTFLFGIGIILYEKIW